MGYGGNLLRLLSHVNNSTENTMNTSRLVNDYVKTYQAKLSIEKKIAEQTEDLQMQQKEIKKQLDGLKASILDILEKPNQRLESTTNYVFWKEVSVKAHSKNYVLVNKEK